MRRSLAIVVVAACSGPAAPPPLTPVAPPAAEPTLAAVEPPVEPPDPEAAKLTIDWATTPLATDADALAAWRLILPVARDWDLRVGQIPDAAIAPLAAAVLRAGNFACPELTGGGCEPGFLGFADPSPTADFDDPCLRRTVALWSLSHVDTEHVAALAPELAALAGSPKLDNEVIDAILSATGEQSEALRLALLGAAMRAGHGAAIDDELHGLSEAAMTSAAIDLHIDAAVEALDVTLARPVFVAAARDQRLRPATRATAIHELAAEVVGAALPRDLDRVLVDALRDPDCGVAATAATTLAAFGRRDALPKRPRSKKVADAMRALCVMAAADAVEPAAAFIGPSGLKVIERTYDPDLEFATDDDDDADGDHDPRTARTVDTIARGQLVAIPYDDQLPAAKPKCAGVTCTLRVAAGVIITLAFAPAKDGGLWLDTIERRDHGDCGPKDP